MSNSRPDAITEVPPLKFFALTYALSWLIWVPLDLSHAGVSPFSRLEGVSGILRLLGVLMPAVAALILTGRSSGRTGIKALLGRLLIWRVGWRWWAAAVLVYPALLVIAGLGYDWFSGGTSVSFTPPASAAAFVVGTVFLLIAALGEEIGWRGVGLPGLQQRTSAFWASILLALGWGLWHLPFWLLLDTTDQFGLSYLALNAALGIPITIYITWFFNHSRFSLLLPLVFHLAFNVVNTALLPVTLNVPAFAVFIVLTWMLMPFIIGHLEPDTKERQAVLPAADWPAAS
jgi:membrane protease YdiL (CAAX protease family)